MKGIPRPSKGGRALKEALLALVDSGEVVERASGKSRKLLLRSALPTLDDMIATLQEEASHYGGEGLKAKLLSEHRNLAPETFERALEHMERSGELVAVAGKSSTVYFGREFAPPPKPTARELAAQQMDKLIESGEAWTEMVLTGTGKGKPAQNKRAVLEEWVREGRLIRFEIALGKDKKAAAYRLPDRRAVSSPAEDAEGSPDWPEMERMARELARRSVDGTASFEEVAEALHTTPLAVKTAVMQQIAIEGPVQLVRGEARDVRHPATAGLEFRGTVYYRFGFID